MKKSLILILFLISVASTFAGAPPDFDEARYKASIGTFDANAPDVKAAVKNLTAVEKRMNAVIIPEIDLRQANIIDVIHFFDDAVSEYGRGAETNDATRIRLEIDKTSVDEDAPLITFAVRKMPLLFAMRLTAKLGGWQYKTAGNTVTLFKPNGPANKVSEDIDASASNPQH